MMKTWKKFLAFLLVFVLVGQVVDVSALTDSVTDQTATVQNETVKSEEVEKESSEEEKPAQEEQTTQKKEENTAEKEEQTTQKKEESIAEKEEKTTAEKEEVTEAKEEVTTEKKKEEAEEAEKKSVKSSTEETKETDETTLPTETEEEESKKLKSDPQNYNIAGWLKSDSNVKINGTQVSSGATVTVKKGDKVELFLSWAVSNSISLTSSDTMIYNLPAGVSFSDRSGYLMNGTTVVGTYTVSGNTISMQYYEDFLAAGNNIVGTLKIDGVISNDVIGDQESGSKEIAFPGIGSVTVEVERDSSKDGVFIQKTMDNSNPNSMTKKATLTVTSTGDNTNVVVTDTMGNALSLKSGSIVVKNAGGTDVTSSVTVNEGNPFTVTIPSMSDKEVYTIEYEVEIKPSDEMLSKEFGQYNMPWDYNDSITNRASVKSDESNGNDSAASVTFDNSWLSKSNQYENGVITYTIVVNETANKDIKGAVLKDIPGTDQTLVEGSFAVSPAVEGLTWEALQSGFTFPEGSTEKYTITYQMTPVVPAIGTKTITNRAEITPSGGQTIGKETYQSVGTDAQIVAKSPEGFDAETKEITWRSTVTVPRGTTLHNLVMEDTFDDTMELVQNDDSVKLDGTKIEVTPITNGFTYTIGDVTAADDADTVYTFEYKTRIKGTLPTTTAWYHNKAKASSTEITKSADSTYTYTVSSIANPLSKWPMNWNEGGPSSNSEKTGIMEWGFTLSGLSQEASGDMTITDTLPDNMEYIEDSAYYYDTKGKVPVTVGENGIIVFDVTARRDDFKNNRIDIRYQTKIIDMAKAAEGYKSYINKAYVTVGDQQCEEVSAERGMQMSKQISKSSVYNSGVAPLVEYTVMVNEGEFDLYPDEDTFDLEDTSGNAIDFKYGSLRVNGEKWSDYTYDNHVLTIKNLPDETKLTITYSGVVNLAPTTSENNNRLDGSNASNTVKFAGKTGDANQASNVVSSDVLESSGTSGNEGKSLGIYKYEENSKNKPIKGAGFTVYELAITVDASKNVTINQPEAATAVKTGSTGTDGYLTVSGLSFDKVYKLVETTVPDGYTKSSDEAIYFVFAGNDNNIYPNNIDVIPANVGTKQYDISNGVRDESEEGSLKLTKTFAGLTDAEKTEAGENITFTVTNEDSSYNATFSYKDDFTNGSLTLNNLTPGEYTVTESGGAVAGYSQKVTYKVGGSETATGTATVVKDQTAEVEVTNTYTRIVDVVIRKTDVGGKELNGATLTITKGNETVAEWTTDTTAEPNGHTVSLQPGTYTLTETTAPNGYEVAESITFTVDKDGKVTVDNKEVGKVTMVDAYSNHTVKISKQDIAGAELAGAELTVTDEEGIVKESWTSDGTVKEISLKPGEYTLTETTAPNGYKVSESITFTVGIDGKVKVGTSEVEKVVMTDDYADGKVIIKKVDIAGNEIGGAKLTITDDKDQEVESWTSEEGKDHEIELYPGTYTLTETQAPGGYEKAESITFVVDEKGNVKVGGKTVGAVTMVDEYSDHDVVISKKDVGGNELNGATLTITKGNETVAEWTTNTTAEPNGHTVSLKPGTYTLTETTAPNGYEVAESITFTVDKDGKVTIDDTVVNKVTMVDAYSDHTVKISKQDIAGAKLAGAKLKVTDENGTEVESWTSDETVKELSLKPGDYILIEVTAPNGYRVATNISFNVGIDGTVTVNNTAVEEIVMTDDYADGKVIIKKVDVAGNEIAGAKLTITDDKDQEVESWTSEEGKDHEVELYPGTYTLTETTAPNGYEKAESIIFVVDEKGNVKVDGETVGAVTMVDEYSDHDVVISKTDVGGNELDGATLTLTKGNEIVAEWTTDTENEPNGHKVSLKPGDYTLTETTAPNGYEKSESITFTVGIDGKVTVKGEIVDKVTMVDAYSNHTVKISKQDIAGAELAGAELKVTKEGGTLVESWTSDGTVKELSLQPGTYTLTETTAPNGYEKAESITFTVDIDGKVTVDNEEVGEVIMVDAYSDHTVKIRKQDVARAELKGAELKVTDENGTLVESWTSDGNVKELSLQPGNYTLIEIKAPDGYKVTSNISFNVGIDGTVTVNNATVEEIVMTDDYADGKVIIKKVDVAGNEIGGAKLTITNDKKEVVESWTSEEGKDHEVELYPGTYTLTETTAPNGYEKAESITFVVDEKGNVKVNGETVGAVTMVDAYSDQEVIISKTDVGGKELDGAKLTITQDGKVIKEWTTDTEAEPDGHKVSLQPGEYTLVEVTAPKGYEIAEEITFKVDKDGKVTVKGNELDGNIVTMVDAYSDHKVVISKKDIGGDELDGAKLTITQDGKVIKEWTTDTKAEPDGHTVELQPGDYTLTEVTAPDGYEKAESIDFKVGIDGKVTVKGDKVDKITMVDDYADRTVALKKVDKDGNKVVGAKLVVLDEEGEEVDSFTTKADEDHEITLYPGEYTLREEEAPEGYFPAADVAFEVPVGSVEEAIEVTMIDEKQEEKSGEIQVTKFVSMVNDDFDVDLIATDAVFKVGLYTDKAGKHPFGKNNIKEIHLKDSSSSTAVYEDLPSGTYYVFELDEDGNPITTIDILGEGDNKYSCNIDGDDPANTSVEIDLDNDETEGSISLQNVYYQLPEGYRQKAEIEIQKNVIVNKEAVTVNDTFYAGIFTKNDDEEYELYKVTELVQNDTVTVEVPLGGENGDEDITYYVFETDENGNRVEETTFAYEISGEGEVTISAAEKAGTIEITNTRTENNNYRLVIEKITEDGEPLAGAEFELTSDNDDFTAQWQSEENGEIFVLGPGTYMLEELQAPDGYIPGENVTFTIDEDGKITLTGEDAKLEGGMLKYINKEDSEEESEEEEVVKKDNGNKKNSSSSKTGDQTPTGFYLITLLGAVFASMFMGGRIILRRKGRHNAR